MTLGLLEAGLLEIIKLDEGKIVTQSCRLKKGICFVVVNFLVVRYIILLVVCSTIIYEYSLWTLSRLIRNYIYS